MSIKSYIISILLCTVTVEMGAQSITTDSLRSDSVIPTKTKMSLSKRLNKLLTSSYYKVKYDTNYVGRPKEKWLLRLLGNQTGNYIHAKGTVNDVYSKYDLHTKRNTTVGLEVNYCDLAATFSLNPAKIKGTYKDYELNFEYHGRKLSIDFNYQRSTSLAGDIKFGNIDHLNEEGLRMNVANITGYYTFNHRKFSFPAALYQNYYQWRSAGSFLAGVSFQGGSIRTTDKLKERNPQAPVVHLTFNNFAIGGGYGYNLVLGKRSQWLFHLSALPSVVLYQHNKLTVNDNRIKDHGFNINMIFNERAAIVYHFSLRYFAGASMMMSNSIFNNDKVTVNQNKWLARAFFGFRL